MAIYIQRKDQKGILVKFTYTAQGNLSKVALETLATIEEWRELGFFYEHIDEDNCWLFIGSFAGIYQLCHILKQYAGNPKNEKVGEHDHLGPYMYLKIGTWKEPVISSYGIFGSLQDIDRLASIIHSRLDKVQPNDRVDIDKEYSSNNEFAIKIIIREEGFDPASADLALKK
jgi:hypothetical protein